MLNGLPKTNGFITLKNLKTNNNSLREKYEMSQTEIGEKLFLKQQTIAKIEKQAIENLKRVFAERKINYKDLLND
jgi:DNA-binding XRE family transcriptional regulator